MAAAGELVGDDGTEALGHGARTAPPASATGSTSTGDVARAATRAPTSRAAASASPRQCRSRAATSSSVVQTSVPSSTCWAFSSGTSRTPRPVVPGVAVAGLRVVVLGDGLTGAPARSRLERVGTQRDRQALGADDEQLLLDPHRAHPAMVRELRVGHRGPSPSCVGARPGVAPGESLPIVRSQYCWG